VRILLTILALTICSLSIAKEEMYACPVSASGYAELVKENKPGGEGFMERDNCYYELLNRARAASDADLTTDILNLNIHLGASGSESYYEFVEKLAINQPRTLLDALSRVAPQKVLRVFEILDDPLVSKRKDIERSLLSYKNNEQYRELLSIYFEM
jgi:hypothetical protein